MSATLRPRRTATGKAGIPEGTTAGDYTVWYRVEGDADHNDSEAASVRVTVARATVTVAMPPVASAITYDSALEKCELSDGSVEPAVKGDFAWVIPDTTPAVADSGRTQYAVTFTPEDQVNYRPATCYITVMVTPANPVGIPPTAISPLIYSGNAQALVQAGSAINGTMKYAVGQTAPATESGWSKKVPTATKAGEYTVWYRVKSDANHNDSVPASVVAEIAKAPISPTLSIAGWTYGDESNAPELKGNPGKGKVTFQYSNAKDGKFTKTIPTQAGSWFVQAVVAETDNYEGITTAPTSFAISKLKLSIFADNKEGVYVDAIKALTYRLSEKIVKGDDLGITLTTTAKATSAPGEYPITLNWNGNRNYKAVLESGVYSIGKRPVVVAANAQTIQAGDRIATGVDQATATGLAEGHRLSEVKLTAASTASNASLMDVIMTTSTIIASDAKIENAKGKDVTENYTITYAKGKLTIVSSRLPTPTKTPISPTTRPTSKPTTGPTVTPTAAPEPTANPDYTLLAKLTASGSDKLKLS